MAHASARSRSRRPLEVVLAALFEPFRLRGLELANRILIAPMCQYSAQDGSASDWHVVHLGHLALSGAALLIVEATGVTPEARITPGDLGLWSDTNEAALARALRPIRAWSSTKMAIQLAHAGRKASTTPPWQGGRQIAPGAPLGWLTEAPSALPYDAADVPPQALDDAGLVRVREAFASAAARAVRLGFDAIEVHMAHGYLLHEFLSPLSNTRQDLYGGSLENRMRFPIAVFDAVRAAVPHDLPVWVRISATDWVPGGWDLEGSVALSRALKAHGCDAIHVSSGGLSPDQRIETSPGYQVPFAERIRAEVGIPTIAAGLITEARQAERIVASGSADAVSLARAMLYDPRWPWHAAAELGATVGAPRQYLRAPPAGTPKHLVDGSPDRA